MLLVKSISPSLSLDFLTRGVGVVKQGFWDGNRRHGQKKDTQCVLRDFHLRTLSGCRVHQLESNQITDSSIMREAFIHVLE